MRAVKRKTVPGIGFFRAIGGPTKKGSGPFYPFTKKGSDPFYTFHSRKSGQAPFILFEGILAILPDVIEPIPDAVLERFRAGSLSQTQAHLQKVWSTVNDNDPALATAILALASQKLDTGYLQPSAGIWSWSCDDRTIIEWDNTDRRYEVQQVWTAGCGRHEVSREQFLAEVRSFDRRLMAEIENRVGQIRTNWSRPLIKIDLEQLNRQSDRSRLSQSYREVLIGPTGRQPN